MTPTQLAGWAAATLINAVLDNIIGEGQCLGLPDEGNVMTGHGTVRGREGTRVLAQYFEGARDDAFCARPAAPSGNKCPAMIWGCPVYRFHELGYQLAHYPGPPGWPGTHSSRTCREG